MKYLIILCLLASGAMAYGQLSPDFPLHANGMLYDDTVMNRLRFMIDSLKLRDKKDGPEGVHYSSKQTTARLVRLDSGDIQGAFADLKKGISFDAFIAKYPQASSDSRILVLLDERPGYQVAGCAYYYNVTSPHTGADRIILPTDEHYVPLGNPPRVGWADFDHVGISGNCVYYLSSEVRFVRGKNVDDPYVFAFYLDNVPTASRLPSSAALLAGYRDRMVDSGSGPFFEGMYFKGARSGGPDFRGMDFGPAQEAFDRYIKDQSASVVAADHQVHPKLIPMNDFFVARRHTDSLTDDSTFKALLAAAIDEVRQKNYYPFVFLERYMDAFDPPAALEIRRHWLPSATCGMDHLTPRLDKMHIAVLAAKTGNWPVFLQAQLSIAADPMGHYPNLLDEGRRVYFLRELEDLNIGVDDILLGNLLSYANGDAAFFRAKQLGRALALESQDRHGLEEKVLRLIADKKLDDYNRLAMHYLFLNYISFLPDGAERSRDLGRLERADSELPGYLSARVRVQKQVVDNHADLTYW